MIIGKIDTYGLIIPYSDLIEKQGQTYITKILRSLTVIEKNTHKKPKGSPLIVRKAYKLQDNMLIIPRVKSHIFLKYKLVDTIVNFDYSDIINIKSYDNPIVPLYQYQEEIVKYLVNTCYTNEQVENNRSICYLQMDTGLGKSRIGCALINALKCATLIVVPTIAIACQWIDECRELYPDMSIGIYNNYKNPILLEDYDIVITVINTLVKKNNDFIKGYGLIIYDEVHEYHSSNYIKLLWLSGQIKYVLGLSATPLERPDGLDQYITYHLGQPIYAKDITDITSVKFSGKVKCIQYYGNYEYTKTMVVGNGVICTIGTINNIIQDPNRIQVVINEILRLHNDNHGILVFAEHRDFLDVLKNQLLLFFDTNTILVEDDEDSISILRGGITKNVLTEAKLKGKHIILTTYGYSRRGISLIEMTAIVLTTPRRNNLRQIIGRILRRGSDESIVREIVDIVDTGSILKGQFNERKKVYEEKQYPISYVKINGNTSVEHEVLPVVNINEVIDMIYQL